jgi:hypothetical protein
VKNQAFTKQDRAVFSNLHCFVGTTRLALDAYCSPRKSQFITFRGIEELQEEGSVVISVEPWQKIKFSRRFAQIAADRADEI